MRFLVLLVALVPLAAQNNNWANVQGVTVGAEVRVRTGSKTVRGQLQSVTADLLVLNVKNSQQMITRQEATRVSVKKKNHRLRNTLLGLGIGAGAGLVIGAATDANCKPLLPGGGSCFLGNNIGKEIFTPLGAAVGLIVGAVIPSGGWRDVYRL
jgi:hypothetical protein